MQSPFPKLTCVNSKFPTRFLTIGFIHFVANILLFQKYWDYFWWFCLCEMLQPLQAWLTCKTSTVKGLIKINNISLSHLDLIVWYSLDFFFLKNVKPSLFESLMGDAIYTSVSLLLQITSNKVSCAKIYPVLFFKLWFIWFVYSVPNLVEKAIKHVKWSARQWKTTTWRRINVLQMINQYHANHASMLPAVHVGKQGNGLRLSILLQIYKSSLCKTTLFETILISFFFDTVFSWMWCWISESSRDMYK